MPQLLDEPRGLDNGQPTVVVGYIKDFLANLTLESDGRLSLLGRPVTAAVNDRFCLNVLQQFGQGVDLGQLATMNRCFLPGADKGTAYALLNENELAGHESRIILADSHNRVAQQMRYPSTL